jgi:hypothetical protein
MRRPASWVIAGILAIGLTSCGGEEAQTPPTPSASPSAIAPSPSATASSFSTGTVVVQKGKGGKDAKAKNPNAVPGLVQSTDPAELAKLIQNNIKSQKTDRDPFSSLPPLIAFTTPRVAGTGLSSDMRKADADKSSSVPELPKFPEIKFPDVPSFPKSFGPSPVQPLGIPAQPLGIPAQPLGIPSLPPIPQPTLARQVEVTGVVKVGNTVQAIVKAPNEPSSRYVGVGQMLSNGQILVKRIEINTGSEPIVVLEENGIEVRVMVGSSKKKLP